MRREQVQSMLNGLQGVMREEMYGRETRILESNNRHLDDLRERFEESVDALCDYLGVDLMVVPAKPRKLVARKRRRTKSR